MAAPKIHRIPSNLWFCGVFGWGAFVFLTLMLTSPFAGWIFLWPAFSFAVASLAYYRDAPDVFGKTARGRLAFHSWGWSLPFCLGTNFAWNILRLCRACRPPDRVADRLWVGPRPLKGELPAEVTMIVDLTCEMWEKKSAIGKRRYLCVPTLDGLPPPARRLLAAVWEVLREPGSVYVHCAQGNGRAPTFAAAVLIARGAAATVEEAESLLRSRRATVRLRPEQRARLKALVPDLIRMGREAMLSSDSPEAASVSSISF